MTVIMSGTMAVRMGQQKIFEVLHLGLVVPVDR
jgi:hypothetical protein